MRDKVIAEIIDEWRSLSALDFFPSHDVKPNDLPKAAAALALAGVPRYAKAGLPELFWPWRKPRFRSGASRDNLVRAGALLLAALEQLDKEDD